MCYLRNNCITLCAMYNYGSMYMYRIIYIQVGLHIEIELYSLFVLFCFTFCVVIYCIPIFS